MAYFWTLESLLAVSADTRKQILVNWVQGKCPNPNPLYYSKGKKSSAGNLYIHTIIKQIIIKQIIKQIFT